MKFIIIAPARSGSTLLRTMLDRHPAVCCSGELFGQRFVRGLSKHLQSQIDREEALNLRQRDAVAFLENHAYASTRVAVGFKLLYSQLFVMENLPAVRWLQNQAGLRVLRLWRRDLIARHVSEVRLLQRARDNSPETNPDGFFKRMATPQATAHSCEIQLAAREFVGRLFADHPLLDIAYESFIAEHADQSRRLCEFLQVDPGGWPPLPAKEDAPADPHLQALRGMPSLLPYVDHA